MLYTFYKQYGNTILLRYKDKNNQTINKHIRNYKPTLYTIKPNSTSDIVNIFKDKVDPIHFADIKDAKEFAKSSKEVSNFKLYGNSKYDNQFIIEACNGQQPEYLPTDIKGCFLDIETDYNEFPNPKYAKFELTWCTIYNTQENRFYTFHTKEWKHNKNHKDIGNLDIVSIKCSNEDDLLRQIILHIEQQNYDYTSGWNSEGFDMPYICNRIKNVLGDAWVNRLSPFKIVNIKDGFDKWGNDQVRVDIVGLPHLDYMQVYQKHNFIPRENFKLDYIAECELNENKIHDELTLKELYEHNPQKYGDYNIQDVNLVKRLDDRLGFISVTLALSYYTLSNYIETLGTVKIWENLVAKYLYTKNIVPLFRQEQNIEREYEGAYVHPPQIGKQKWCISFDLNSLYPHVEMQCNIGPETHVPYYNLPQEIKDIKNTYTIDSLINGLLPESETEKLKKYNLSMCANFEFYKRDFKSFFSEIKSELYAGRKTWKKKMLGYQQEKQNINNKDEYNKLSVLEVQCDNMQMAFKILLNAGYGAAGNKHFLYYKVENAEAITLTGQFVNKHTTKSVNKFLNTLFKTENVDYHLAGDTDSAYFTIEPFVKMACKGKTEQETIDLIDKFSKTILTPYIDKITDGISNTLNSIENKMVWEREGIFETMILVQKKKYVGKVLDSEGVRFKEPKYKIIGMESKKSDTPAWAREYLAECYKIALDKTENDIHKLFSSIESKFNSFDIKEISMPKKVTDIDKWVDSSGNAKLGTPKHVKGCILYNQLIKKHGLNLEPIRNGNAVRLINLVDRNPYKSNCIAFIDDLPKEFGIEQFIDRKNIFDKSFKEKLDIFLEAVKWNHKKVNTLDLF